MAEVFWKHPSERAALSQAARQVQLGKPLSTGWVLGAAWPGTVAIAGAQMHA